MTGSLRLPLGTSTHNVRELGIPAEERLLGTRSDREVARQLGRTTTGVQAKRQRLGVLGFRTLNPPKRQAVPK